MVPRTIDGERLALAATVLVVAFLPVALPVGPGNFAPVDVLIVAAAAICLFWAGSSRLHWRTPYAIPVAVLITGGALGALAGPVPTAGVVAIVQDLVLLAWCWTVVNISHSAANLGVLLKTWVYSSIVWATLMFVGLATGITQLSGQVARQGSRAQLTFADPNYAANYFFISIMIMWATARPRRPWMRLSAYILLGTALAFTGSNEGIVQIILGVTVAALLGVYRRSGLVPAVTLTTFILLAAGLAAATISPEAIQQAGRQSQFAFIRDGIGRSAETGGDHALILQEGIRLYSIGGPLGEGPVSTKVRLRAENAPRIKEAHDDYVAALVERGAIGFVGVLLLVAGIGLRTLAVTRARLSNGIAAVVVRPNALAGAVAGTLIAGIVYELLHVRHVWALLGIVAGIYAWGRQT
jgi:hypothetical protein